MADGFSAWSWLPAHRSLARDEPALVGLLSFVLHEHPPAAAALFLAYLTDAKWPDRARDRFVDKHPAAEEIVAALEAIRGGARTSGSTDDPYDLMVATEIPMSPYDDEQRTYAPELGRADLAIAVEVHRYPLLRAQLIVEAKAEGEKLTPLERRRRTIPLDPRLEPFRETFQPASYAGVWKTQDQEMEAGLRIMGTLGTSTYPDEWHRQLVERYPGSTDPALMVGLGPNLSWDSALTIVEGTDPPAPETLRALRRAVDPLRAN